MASLLTVALHGKLEYFTDILRTLLSDLVAQYVAKNPRNHYIVFILKMTIVILPLS